jgi:hypothetical protein
LNFFPWNVSFNFNLEKQGQKANSVKLGKAQTIEFCLLKKKLNLPKYVKSDNSYVISVEYFNLTDNWTIKKRLFFQVKLFGDILRAI